MPPLVSFVSLLLVVTDVIMSVSHTELPTVHGGINKIEMNSVCLTVIKRTVWM